MGDVDPALRTAKKEAERQLLNYPGVTGVDVGYKEVGGRRTDQLAIRVLVAKKKPDPRPQERIPESVGGFPTDVIERKYELQVLSIPAEELVVQADPQRYDVLRGGISIGPCRPVGATILGGTLGMVVQDSANGKPMLLGNFHVLCGDNSWTTGDVLAQPARIDQGICPDAGVASLQRAVLTETVDGAVAEITARTAASEIVDIGPVTGTNTVNLNDPVRKRGRSTGLTYGFVDGLDLTIIVQYPGIGERTLVNQIGVRPDTARNPRFSASGDSGSAVVNAAGEVVGLHFAGNAADGHAAANPIVDVLAALAVTIPASTPAPPPPPPPPPRGNSRLRLSTLTPYPPPWRPSDCPPGLSHFPPPPYGMRFLP